MVGPCSWSVRFVPADYTLPPSAGKPIYLPRVPLPPLAVPGERGRPPPVPSQQGADAPARQALTIGVPESYCTKEEYVALDRPRRPETVDALAGAGCSRRSGRS